MTTKSVTTCDGCEEELGGSGSFSWSGAREVTLQDKPNLLIGGGYRRYELCDKCFRRVSDAVYLALETIRGKVSVVTQ